MTLASVMSKRDLLLKELKEIKNKTERTEEDISRGHEIMETDLPKVDREISLLRASEPVSVVALEDDEPEERVAVDEAESTRVQVGENRESLRRFNSLGEQLCAVARASRDGQVDPRLFNPDTRAASGMSSTVPSDGGFLIQKDFSTEIMKAAFESGEILRRVRRIPISSDSNGIKLNGIDEDSRARGSRWGGVRTYWLEEAGEITSSKPKTRQMELSLHKLGSLFYATDELLRDVSAINAIANQSFAEEMRFEIEDAIIRGNGAGKPLGLLDDACNATVEVAKESGQSADTILAENVFNMRSRMFARSRANAVWFINQDVEPELHNMYLAVGTGGAPVYLPTAGNLSSSPWNTLMGHPVIPVEYCSTLGDAGDIIFADLSQYVIIEKEPMNMESSMHVRFIYDEMAFRFIYRIDGQPLWKSAVTPYKGTNTISPFITLAERA